MKVHQPRLLDSEFKFDWCIWLPKKFPKTKGLTTWEYDRFLYLFDRGVSFGLNGLKEYYLGFWANGRYPQLSKTAWGTEITIEEFFDDKNEHPLLIAARENVYTGFKRCEARVCTRCGKTNTE